MQRLLSIKAVLIGTVADLVATFGAGVAVVIIFTALGNDSEQYLSKFESSLLLQIIVLSVGLLCVMLGGYVAGRTAKDAPVFNGFAVGVLAAIIGLFFMEGNPLWFNIASFLLVIPFGYLGGVLAK